jgi:hypothetical protein
MTGKNKFKKLPATKIVHPSKGSPRRAIHIAAAKSHPAAGKLPAALDKARSGLTAA